MEGADYVLVLTTLPAGHDTAAFARALLEARLVACVNVLPAMRSIYRWKGAIEDEEERQVLMKTRRARVDALRERLRALHPYEVPEFLVVPIREGDEGYLLWISESTV